MRTPTTREIRTIFLQRARCALCNKPPMVLNVEQQTNGDTWIVAICHGPKLGKDINFEYRIITEEAFRQIVTDGDLGRFIAALDLTFFRRNFAEYHRPTLRELLEMRR